MKEKLNLASGKNYFPGWVNIDIGSQNQHGENIKVDITHDLNNFPYPFADNTFEEVFANQIFEHLDNPSGVMKELVRVCKNKAVITIRVPHFSDVGAYEEPGHKHYFALNSIDYMLYGCKVNCKELELHHNSILKIIGKIFTLSPFIYEHYLTGFFAIKGIKWIVKVRK